jgi:hypothetical protein
MTHTYAVLEISREAFDEIAAKLQAAGYQHAFHKDDGETVVDMHGIALKPNTVKPLPVQFDGEMQKNSQ